MMQRNYRQYYVGYRTVVIREIQRFFEFWLTTLVPSVLTTALYFLIFGRLIGGRIGLMGGVSYVEYITPGLIMMAVINNSYAGVSFSFFATKFFKHIENLLIAPLPNWLILSGYITGGIIRGVLNALLVTITALFFTRLPIHHFFLMVLSIILTSALFSLAGFVNAMLAKNFDDVGFVPTFVLTPLAYLGGVFFSVQLLTGFWHTIAFLNPILYFINLFRFGMLGITDVNVVFAFSVLVILTAILFVISMGLLNKGVGIKT
ncbi:MAG TPA: ABC transporter permease [Gammaproteobacteria bacterium]|nr:ABC transporter permease [Gammaproteobacteria bacterium]